MRIRVRRSTEHHLGRTRARVLVICGFLLLALTALLVYLNGVASAIEMLYGVMQSVVFPVGILGMIVLGIFSGIAFLKGRKIRRREGIETIARPETLPLEDVTKVISINPVVAEGLYIYFQESDEEVATLLVFMQGMESELEAAKELFRNHGIPVKSGN